VSAYTEQEELEKFKAWWKEYGNAVVFGALLGIALLAGNRFWNNYTEQRLYEASELYEQMLEDVSQKRQDSARETGSKLATDYSSTPYGGMAALLLARLEFDAGNQTDARKRLHWAMENGRDSATVHTARLRLAQLMAAAGEAESALALLDIKDRSGFAAAYEELRGDLLVAINQLDEARIAYRAALAEIAADSAYQQILKMKLDNLVVEKNP
jgi:predicted negative regulator of RcsB-dependent stress response